MENQTGVNSTTLAPQDNVLRTQCRDPAVNGSGQSSRSEDDEAAQSLVTTTSIQPLDTDILRLVFELVYASSPSTVSALMQVNRSWYSIARELKHRHHYLRFDAEHPSPKTAEFMDVLLDVPENQYVLDILRSITITHTALNNPHHPSEFRWLPRFVGFLSQIPNLRDITFTPGPPPLDLLVALEKYHPRARLHLPHWSRFDFSANHNVQSEIALANSLNLHTIRVDAFASGQKLDFSFPAFKRIIMSAPNLKEVQWSRAKLMGGCVATVWTEDEWQAEQEQAELFLKDLPKRQLAKVEILKIDDSSHSLLKLIDSTTLSTFDSSDYFQRFSTFLESRFPRLETLSLLGCCEISDTIVLNDFLHDLPPLKSLAISLPVSPTALDMEDILNHHGPSLLKLTLSTPENDSFTDQRPTLSASQIISIRDSCHRLEAIEVDVDRSLTGVTEYNILIILATFPHLETININFDTGQAQKNRDPWETWRYEEDESEREGDIPITSPFDPMNDKWLENMWSVLLHEKQKNRTRSLQEVNLNHGDYILKASERDDRCGEVWILNTMNNMMREPKSKWKIVPAAVIVDGEDQGIIRDVYWEKAQRVTRTPADRIREMNIRASGMPLPDEEDADL